MFSRLDTVLDTINEHESPVTLIDQGNRTMSTVDWYQMTGVLGSGWLTKKTVL